ncbi:hypothetical protein RhiirA4_527067 [Rhizophagus irregularis]|uniref:Uncharacterized protein n=1 Tax=Rhizophagus irregularis TaxID=588596 RepID=A0A2I1GRC6_9GLOM|nr:hypothetical protein RhiirA4_527067 [Rhizophagus irregularis]
MNDNEEISQKANTKKQSYIVNNKSDIIISLDEQFAQPIEKREKTYEFRKYKLSEETKRLWIYVRQPVAQLIYIAEIDKAVEYPNKISEEGLGNKDFNQGLKVSKFAYKINHLYKLVNPIDSKQLKIHHPLGGGSYVFKEKYIDYILEHVSKSDVRISIGAQPNGSPHFGTIVTFSLAFSLAQQLKNKGKNVEVILELVDTAISEEHSFNNIKYQKSLSYTKEIDKHIDYYEGLLRKLNSYSGVVFMIRKQSDFNSHPRMSEVISTIIKEREKIGSLLSPKSKVIALRVACPQCGLADKHGKKNIYEGNNNVISSCPEHGPHSLDTDKEPQKLEFNTPLRNLVKGVVYSEDNKDVTVPYSWVRVTGGDYAGTYQEQILYKGASILGVDVTELPFILYSPLVIDWSGSKLSKSLYISEGAYGYLKEQGYDYLIDYSSFEKAFGDSGLNKLYDETGLWLTEPYKLFRSYSIYYFVNLFKSDENNIVHQAPVISGKKVLSELI